MKKNKNYYIVNQEVTSMYCISETMQAGVFNTKAEAVKHFNKIKNDLDRFVIAPGAALVTYIEKMDQKNYKKYIRLCVDGDDEPARTEFIAYYEKQKRRRA